MPDRGNWEVKYRLCCLEKWHIYVLRHTDYTQIDLFNTFLLPKCQPLLYNIAKTKIY